MINVLQHLYVMKPPTVLPSSITAIYSGTEWKHRAVRNSAYRIGKTEIPSHTATTAANPITPKTPYYARGCILLRNQPKKLIMSLLRELSKLGTASINSISKIAMIKFFASILSYSFTLGSSSAMLFSSYYRRAILSR